MPPALFIADVTGTTGGANTEQKFAVPAATRPGDVQIAIVVMAFQGSTLDVANNADGWTLLAVHALTNATFVVVRRTAKEADPATLTVNVTAAATWVGSCMLTYRDLEGTFLASAAGNVAVSTNFVCPSQNATRYSDLYLGIVVVSSAVVAVTPPAGSTERHEHAIGAREFEVFEVLPEAVGATGTKTATTAANQSGSLISIMLQGNPAPGFGKSFTFTPMGAIGLPVEGI